MHTWRLITGHALAASLHVLAGCDSGSTTLDPASGGAPASSGGALPSGGMTAVGGMPVTGGDLFSGGVQATGGSIGGMASSGGSTVTTGGVVGTGGDLGTGGMGSGGTAEPPRHYTRKDCELVTGTEGAIGPLNLRVEQVVQGLEVPWGVAFLPDGDMLVTERPGRLRLIRDGQLVTSPVLEVDIAEIPFANFSLGSEGGLLGVLLHPDFANNRQFYLYYTINKGSQVINQLGLYTLDANRGQASLVRLLLDDIPAGVHHQGGRMRIGPDGKLYVGVGAYDPGLAQQPQQLAGKLLRLNLDGSVPADNPTAGSYVYLTGVRNTQGYDWFDADHMLVMDHGPTSVDPGVPEKGWDEFNVVKAGENLGWPEVLGCSTGSGISEPVLVWQASMPPGGAAIYTGTAIAQWQGSFMVGTLGLSGFNEGQHLHRIAVDPENPYAVQEHEVYLKGTYGRLRTVIMGPDGHLYVTTSNCDGRGTCPPEGDRILRIAGVQ